MNPWNSYASVGQLIKILPVPYVLGLVLLLIWPLLGSIAMLAYWGIVLVLSRRLGSLATAWHDVVLSLSGTWLLLSAIAGLGTTILNVAIPIDAHLGEMNAILDATTDPELALQLIAPYVIKIMVNAMVATPMQILIPAACGLFGWIKFKSHVDRISDMQRYVIEEGIQKLIVAHKLQVIMGFLLVGTMTSIWGVFASIAAGGILNGFAIIALFIATIVLGIGVIVTAIASFFTLLPGYSRTGYALLLVKVDQTTGRGTTPSVAVAAEMRCHACGNSFTSLVGIKYCPVCGATLP